jgi:putative phage-type endonuclease
MGLLPYYYDKIIYEALLENPVDFDNITNIKEIPLYQIISNAILKEFGVLYEDKLPKEIWKVIRSLRRPEAEIREQFRAICQINETLPLQRSPEWYKFRENLLTASGWGNILGYIGSRKEVLLQKCGYEPAQFKGNEFTRWGTKYEPIATRIYERRTGKKIIDFGCMRHPAPENFFLGASPDGISDSDFVMLEIKCPPRRVICGTPTDYYWAQMQGQLEVCDLERCDFLECKLVEFNSCDEYMEHIQMVEAGLTTENVECGVSIDFRIDADTIKTIHSEFFIKGDAINEFIINGINENKTIKFIGPTYWRIEIYQVNPVFRDREWFAWAREHLKNFYDEWQFYKSVGYKSLLTERQFKPKKDDMEDTKITDYEGFVVPEPETSKPPAKKFVFR